jgi:hypothetical protein
MGTGGKAIEVKPTGSSSVEIFIPLSDLDISKSDFPVTIRNFHISGWNFSTKENDGTTLNNTGMSFIGGRIIANDVLVLRVRNTNATPRFLFSI